jgi:amylosucrase
MLVSETTNHTVVHSSLSVSRDPVFTERVEAARKRIHGLYQSVYSGHPQHTIYLERLENLLWTAFQQRSPELHARDTQKKAAGYWHLDHQITGMSLYVDRCCGSLVKVQEELAYFKELGVNFLHLMPIFESPEGESDGGYAVSDFRKVDSRFGTLDDLKALQKDMSENGMYLMLDIVLNHTSHRHEWAQKARAGDPVYQDYFYMYDSRTLPDLFEQTMPEVFPEAAPGSFTFVPECNKWVMTVFHDYQWDLNFTNPAVFIDMLDHIFFYANLGVDILRIDAPAFIWKQIGTTCQNLPQAHTLLQLIRQCVQVAAPGMALLGEAIVAPKEVMQYFGVGENAARECDVAYGATNMALQWDALATGKTQVMLEAQHAILSKPFGTTWITYTRCHDDIGLAYDDDMIAAAGFDPYQHRKFLKEYYSGVFEGSPAKGALFAVNPKTQDARISGTLASLCGLEKAIADNDAAAIDIAVKKILLMQAQSLFMGGIPMLFYGDEMGYTNDYSYLTDPGKSYDNRWMHRPEIHSEKKEAIHIPGTPEQRIYSGTQRLIALRRQNVAFSDYNNLIWLRPHNIHIAGFIRSFAEQRFFCLFNYSSEPAWLTWYAFKENEPVPRRLYDHWEGKYYDIGSDDAYFIAAPYQFYLLERV